MHKYISFFIVVTCMALAQNKTPERVVKGNTITSSRDPKLSIELPKSVQHVGVDRWVLYDIADCELHAFVDADPQKNVQRLYWVQFEGYIPEKPGLKHTYDSPRHTSIGGLDFYVDSWVRANDAAVEPGSDREHIENMIRKAGYKMPGGMIYVRLVHLLDEQKRKELMVIYGEDAAGTGHSVAELAEGGNAHASWSTVENGLVDRAVKKIVIKP